MDTLFVAGDGALPDAEDVEELVVEALGFALLVRGVGPFARERGGSSPDLVPGEPHRRVGSWYWLLHQAQHREYVARDGERLCEHRAGEPPREASLEAGEFSPEPPPVSRGRRGQRPPAGTRRSRRLACWVGRCP